MKTSLFALLLAGLVLVAGCQTASPPTPSPADGRVTVTFQAPEKFTDFRDSFPGTDKGQEHYMTLIRKFIVEEVGRRLAEGQTLSVTFTDIDLAGDFLPAVSRGIDDIRIVKEIYFPRMNLNFELRDASGAVLKQGERKLIDMNFMSSLSFRKSDELFYDLEMLRNWLRTEFK